MLTLTIKYSIFALVATVFNLLAQSLTLNLFSFFKYNLYFSILMGTGVGLIVKYVLDKKYIFYYATSHIKEDIFKLIIYSLMAVITTLIFWSFELSFWHIFKSSPAKYTGAILGLAIGYFIKYHLDKKFVFV
ncbi:GtrA family protein [Candidatus Margulisiibacteriota bacterium]